MNKELEWMCKETVVAYFKILSLHFPEETCEKHENPHDRLSPGRILNLRHSKYDTGATNT
jgi:hypothetical protein